VGKEINFKIISAALSSTKLKDQDKLAIVVDQLSSYIPNPTQTIETKVLQSLLEGLYQYSAQNPQAIELFFNGLTQYIRTKQLKQEGYLFSYSNVVNKPQRGRCCVFISRIQRNFSHVNECSTHNLTN
jgi:hypothetical protein